MKAKVKATGQIIDVYPVEGVVGKEQMYKENELSNLFYKESALEFNDTIDWEERRFQIAKDMLAAIESNPHPQMFTGRCEEQAKWAVRFADELIKRLKEDKQ